MYNLPPPYSSANNYSKARKLYNKEFYNPNKINNSNKSNFKENYNLTSRKEEFNNSSEHDVLFEIFGLKIYFDDVLILCILLFLYQEGIQDEYLFIALILLLLS